MSYCCDHAKEHIERLQRECEPFAYATFDYDHRYTSNAGTYAAAHALAVSLGAKEPVEHRRK